MPATSSISCLIVDDQQTMRSLVRTGLQQLGFRTIHEAADGEDGLRIMLSRPIQLVISDYNMPKLNGFELLKRISKSIVPVSAVMLTMHNDEAMFAKAVELAPKNYDAIIGLGVAQRGLNDLDGAEASYKKAISIDSSRGVTTSPCTGWVTRDSSDQYASSAQSSSAGRDRAVTKSVDRPVAFQGDTVTFTVTVANLGPSATTGVRVEDLLPEGLAMPRALLNASSSLSAGMRISIEPW